METIKRHRFSVTVGTVVLCVIAVFSFAFGLGAEQKEAMRDIEDNAREIRLHVADDKREREISDLFEKKIGEAIIVMKQDIKHIKETVDQIRK